MILDGQKISSIRNGRLEPLIKTIESQKETINKLVERQLEQTRQIEGLVETMNRIVRVLSVEKHPVETQSQKEAVSKITQLMEMVKDNASKDDIDNLANKNKNKGQWEFTIKRDAAGKMKSVKAKEI